MQFPTFSGSNRLGRTRTDDSTLPRPKIQTADALLITPGEIDAQQLSTTSTQPTQLTGVKVSQVQDLYRKGVIIHILLHIQRKPTPLNQTHSRQFHFSFTYKKSHTLLMEIAYQTIKLFQKRKYKKNEKKLLKRLLELAKEHAYHI